MNWNVYEAFIFNREVDLLDIRPEMNNSTFELCELSFWSRSILNYGSWPGRTINIIEVDTCDLGHRLLVTQRSGIRLINRCIPRLGKYIDAPMSIDAVSHTISHHSQSSESLHRPALQCHIGNNHEQFGHQWALMTCDVMMSSNDVPRSLMKARGSYLGIPHHVWQNK